MAGDRGIGLDSVTRSRSTSDGSSPELPPPPGAETTLKRAKHEASYERSDVNFAGVAAGRRGVHVHRHRGDPRKALAAIAASLCGIGNVCASTIAPMKRVAYHPDYEEGVPYVPLDLLVPATFIFWLWRRAEKQKRRRAAA
jgi:hypothetical protein